MARPSRYSPEVRERAEHLARNNARRDALQLLATLQWIAPPHCSWVQDWAASELRKIRVAEKGCQLPVHDSATEGLDR